MAEALQFTIGAKVSCSDGECGEVIRLVVNPLLRAKPRTSSSSRSTGRGSAVWCRSPSWCPRWPTPLCSPARWPSSRHSTSPRRRTSYRAAVSNPTTCRPRCWSFPYYGLGPGNVTPPVTTDALPLGEVAVRRDEIVHASDGEIGRVAGLVIEPVNHHVTHVLLQEGHFWGRKEVVHPHRHRHRDRSGRPTPQPHQAGGGGSAGRGRARPHRNGSVKSTGSGRRVPLKVER